MAQTLYEALIHSPISRAYTDVNDTRVRVVKSTDEYTRRFYVELVSLLDNPHEHVGSEYGADTILDVRTFLVKMFGVNDHMPNWNADERTMSEGDDGEV